MTIMRPRRVNRAALFLAFTILAVLSSEAARADDKGWALTQRSSQMGDIYTFVSPNGLKWTVPKLGANIVTMGPNWSVTMFNEKTKNYYTTTFAEWQKQISKRDARAAEMKANNWVKSTGGTIAGMKATKYVMQNSAPVQSGRKTLGSVAKAECWLADDIIVPASVSDMLSNTYGMPRTKYFPLRISYVSADGRPGTALDTFRTENRPMPNTYFTAPGGYKLVSSQAEVFMDDETQQIMNDMAAEMGVEAPRRQQVQRQGTAVRQPLATPSSNDLTKMLESLKGK